eukprot:COSAG05_NODE_3362_length_2117_cov_1.266601_1_plen_497_part_10
MELLRTGVIAQSQSSNALLPVGGCTCKESWSWMGQDYSCGVCVDPVTSPAIVELIAHNVECNSADIYLGEFETLLGCTTACVDTSDCQYFTYGLSSGPQGNKNGGCYAEVTDSANCDEGFQSDSYDFYKIADSSTTGPWCIVEGFDCGMSVSPNFHMASDRWQYCETVHSNENQCVYTNDGECDSGTYCPQGTDIQDCAADAQCSGNHDGWCTCPDDKIGDGECHPSCNTWLCTFDGGDCDAPTYSQDTSDSDRADEDNMCAAQTDKSCNISCECGFFQACDAVETPCDAAFRVFKHCAGHCDLNWPLSIISILAIVTSLFCIGYCFRDGCQGNRVSVRSIPVSNEPTISTARRGRAEIVVHAVPVHTIPSPPDQQAQIDVLTQQIQRLTAAATASVSSVASVAAGMRSELAASMPWAVVDVSQSSSEESRPPSPTLAPAPPPRMPVTPRSNLSEETARRGTLPPPPPLPAAQQEPEPLREECPVAVGALPTSPRRP